MFASLAKLVEPLTRGLIGFVSEALDGVIAALPAMTSALKAAGQAMPHHTRSATSAPGASTYPLYDESDLSELESEEISEAWDQYLRWDIYRDLPEDLRDLWDAIDDPSAIRDAFYEALSDIDYYPEHSGYDIQWDSKATREAIEIALHRLAGKVLCPRPMPGEVPLW